LCVLIEQVHYSKTEHACQHFFCICSDAELVAFFVKYGYTD